MGFLGILNQENPFENWILYLHTIAALASPVNRTKKISDTEHLQDTFVQHRFAYNNDGHYMPKVGKLWFISL